jgi:hypothetical protein
MLSTLPSDRHPFIYAALAFLVVLIVGYGSDLISMNHPRWMIVFRYEKLRGNFLSEKVRVIREMNAFVRNELQVLYAAAEQPDKTRLSTIQRTVEHVEWALRELLPGKQSLSASPANDSADDRADGPEEDSFTRTA